MGIQHTVVQSGENWYPIARRLAPAGATSAQLGTLAQTLSLRNGYGGNMNVTAKLGEVLHYFDEDIPVVVAPPPPPPPDPEPEPEPEPTAWQNKAKLIPPPGKILIGVACVNDNPSAYVTEFGEPHIDHRYSTSASTFISDLNNIPKTRIPFVNWKIGGQMNLATYQAAISGTYDAQARQIRDAIKARVTPVFIALSHEPENDDTGPNDDEYVAMWRRIAPIIKEATNAVLVWNMMGYRGHLSRLDKLFPGTQYVDWIAFDPYARNASYNDFPDFADQSNTSPYLPPGSLTWAKKHNLPIMFAEWGIGSIDPNDNPINPPIAILSAASVNDLKTRHPLVRALVYWDAPGEGNYVLTRSAVKAAYHTFLDNPTFDVDLSPVL